VLDEPELARTLVVVSSKSGTTEETRSFAAYAQARVAGPSHLVAITDPGSELDEQARAEGWGAVLTNPEDIGGRYSALSLFGMAPAALVGVDTDEIWERGAAMAARCAANQPLEDNPAALLAAFMAGLASEGRDKLTLLAPPELVSLGDWIEQLVAESTGKLGVGVVPVVGEVSGEADVYGPDRAFVSLRLAGREDLAADAVADAGHPLLRIDLDDRHDLGGEFLRWELATALAGVLLGVNPFDEPNVAESKANTMAVLDAVASGEPLPSPASDDPADLLAAMEAGDYVAVQAYLDPLSGAADALRQLCTTIRDTTRAAVTLGWGPRFLHSTGQLHKGGPDTVVSLQLVDAALWSAQATSAPIPGRDYDFATLIRAQATGDLRSLRTHGRRVAQYAVDGPADIERLTDTLARTLG
jgi:transaldolase / glucose-6-phosphate isomerase